MSGKPAKGLRPSISQQSPLAGCRYLLARFARPMLGLGVGTVLGVLDGASAWAYPEARSMMTAIIIGSTIKGAVTGVVAGFVARRVHSLALGVAIGLALGGALSVLAAASSPPGPDGSQHFAEIVLPGMLLGAMVGFITQRYPKHASGGALLNTALLVAALVPAHVFGAAALTQDPHADSLEPLARLVGTWKGTSSGTPGEGTVERQYRRVLNGHYIQVENRSVYLPQERNTKGEVHEDVGFLSFDRARKRFVLRQFHVEGFVAQYVSEDAPPPATWVFTSEAIENIGAGWRAREAYHFDGPDALEEVFELAAPGKDFEVYSRARLRRVK